MTQEGLEGIRVLDFSSQIAGPYCSKLFVDAGAEVGRTGGGAGPGRIPPGSAELGLCRSRPEAPFRAMGDVSLEEWVAGQGGRSALVLTDVVRSTLLLYATGTISYMRVIEAHRRRATGLIESFGGRVIDLNGDATFAAFARAADAYAYATAILADTGDPGLRVRVGVHYGTVHARGPGLFGRSVHFVARLAERGGQESVLWASEDARTALEAEAGEGLGGAWVRQEGCELPGVPGKHTLWRLMPNAAPGLPRD